MLFRSGPAPGSGLEHGLIDGVDNGVDVVVVRAGGQQEDDELVRLNEIFPAPERIALF